MNPPRYITEVIHELSTHELRNLSRELRRVLNAIAPAKEEVSPLLANLISLNKKDVIPYMENLTDIQIVTHFEIVRRFEDEILDVRFVLNMDDYRP